MQRDSTDVRDGIIAGLAAYLIWGILPVYFKLVGSADALEVLTHRIIWAVPFGALILTARRQWAEVGRALTHRAMAGWLAVAAALIAVNWFVYIWAIQQERIFEGSLGYYINPLTNMLVGVLYFGERLRRLQLVAVVLATIGVLILAMSGRGIPWVALVLALSFTAYASIRKKVVIGGMPGLFVETLLLLPFAATWLVWLLAHQKAAFGGPDTALTFWLLMGGPITALPLLCFVLAARRLSLTTVGFMQFLAPTLQFLTGIYYGETLTTAHLLCFGFIWVAVIVFSADAYRAGKRKPVGPQTQRA